MKFRPKSKITRGAVRSGGLASDEGLFCSETAGDDEMEHGFDALGRNKCQCCIDIGSFRIMSRAMVAQGMAARAGAIPDVNNGGGAPPNLPGNGGGSMATPSSSSRNAATASSASTSSRLQPLRGDTTSTSLGFSSSTGAPLQIPLQAQGSNTTARSTANGMILGGRTYSNNGDGQPVNTTSSA
ncbi:unnamed protein product [Amoebophrya sp. A25]|nr:unnamed protein product [Amoebophrya sp. A25]|eukprot:GSA25T00011127001.1